MTSMSLEKEIGPPQSYCRAARSVQSRDLVGARPDRPGYFLASFLASAGLAAPAAAAGAAAGAAPVAAVAAAAAASPVGASGSSTAFAWWTETTGELRPTNPTFPAF